VLNTQIAAEIDGTRLPATFTAKPGRRLPGRQYISATSKPVPF
jgi:hypothetical protein